jgi:RNA polymerase sigma factor (sigma-70 family)
MASMHSITRLLSGVKRQDKAAVQALFVKCYERLAKIGRRKLAGKPSRGFDEDDVVNSAFCEFLNRAAGGTFKKLENREDVWQILTLLVGDKVGDRLRHERRKKRGGGETDVALEEVAEAISKLDDPSLEAEIDDALAKLPSDDHRRVVELLAEGRTHEEIAEALKVSVRTVDRRAEDVRLAILRILGIDGPKKKSSGTTGR